MDIYLPAWGTVLGGREGQEMTFARKMIRFAALALMAALLFAFSMNALAVTDPVEFTLQVSPDTLTAPGSVNVTVRVANVSDTDMKDPVTLYDPSGNVVTAFGDGGSYRLAANAMYPWEGTWKMTDDQLMAGEVVYTLKYHLEDENGELVSMNATASAKVKYTGERVNLSVNRSVTPEVVRSGKEATITYELYNNGNVEIKDVRVKENLSRTAQKVDKLQPGEKKTLTFSVRMGNADLTSSATITYKAGEDTKGRTLEIEELVIPVAKPNLDIQISSPAAGVNIGEAAKLQITFTNNGNVSYSNVKVTDAKKGEIFTNISIPAGQTVVKEKEFILKEKTTFKVTATLPDNTGETKTLASNELVVGVFDPEKTLLLTLNLVSDQQTVQQTPANVRFTLNVTNNSNIKAEKIAIKHGDTEITTIGELAAGESRTIVRDVRISQAGKFRFTASAVDSMNNEVTFDSNTLQLSYAPATPAPTEVVRPTVAPPQLLTPAPVDEVLFNTRNALMMVAGVLGAAFGVVFVLFAVSSVVRMKKNAKSKAAYDHLELSERRDYTEPADEDETDVELPRVEPVETLPVDEKPAGDGEGSYRISRADEEKDAPKARKAVKAKAVTEEEE